MPVKPFRKNLNSITHRLTDTRRQSLLSHGGAKTLYRLRKFLHEEVVISAQSLNRNGHLVAGRRATHRTRFRGSENSRKQMKVLGTNMHRQPRPEKIQQPKAGVEIPAV
jgi:hypothetical protein